MADPVRVGIESEGGLVGDALVAARAIETRPGATVVAPVQCDSACLIVLMAGTRRLADSDISLGFHANSDVTAEAERVKIFGFDLESWMRRSADDDYLIRRGVPAKVVAEANRRGHDRLYPIPAGRALASGILTDLTAPVDDDDADETVDASG